MLCLSKNKKKQKKQFCMQCWAGRARLGCTTEARAPTDDGLSSSPRASQPATRQTRPSSIQSHAATSASPRSPRLCPDPPLPYVYDVSVPRCLTPPVIHPCRYTVLLTTRPGARSATRKGNRAPTRPRRCHIGPTHSRGPTCQQLPFICSSPHSLPCPPPRPRRGAEI